MRKFLLVLFFLASSFIVFPQAFAETQDTCKELGDPSKRADCYRGLIKDLQGQKKTLSNQIAVMDSQIRLTESRILATQNELANLAVDINTANKKISNLESALDNLTKVLLNRIVATYEIGSAQSFGILLTSDNISSLFSRLNYLRVAQQHDKQLIYATQQAKNDYANQKDIFEAKKKKTEILKASLETYTNQLNQEKLNKQNLLSVTNNDEVRYQQLLREAQAQVTAFKTFATSRFGTSLVPHQELSDSWGRYYNQRDANWGNNLIGYSSETIAAVGCLLTSYAMVATHYGGTISPADVAANSGNFFSSTAYFNKPGPSANGRSVESRDNPSLQDLRDALNSGASVIAGLSSDGGPYPVHYSDHWVVLRSIDGDSFRINDPVYQGAINVSLNDNYSGWAIIEARIYR